MRMVRFLAVLIVTATAGLFAQAPNDECATATVVGSLPFNVSQDTRLATPNASDPKFTCNDTAGLG